MPTQPTSQPSSVPTAGPTYDASVALSISFDSSLSINGVDPAAFVSSEQAMDGFRTAVLASVEQGSVTINGASRRKLRSLQASTTVDFTVVVQTNNIDFPRETYDEVLGALTVSVSSGAFVGLLQSTGGPLYDGASVDAESLSVAEPAITNPSGVAITDYPTSYPTSLDNYSEFRMASVNMVIGITVITILVLLAVLVGSMWYAKKYNKVQPTETYHDISRKVTKIRNFDEPLSFANNSSPPKHLRDEELNALSSNGFHVKKCWEQKGDDNVTVSIADQSPNFELKRKPGYDQEMDQQRPDETLSFQKMDSVMSHQDLEARITPKASMNQDV